MSQFAQKNDVVDLIMGPVVAGSVLPYENRLDRDLEWAMSEGSIFFEGRGAVQDAMKRITKRLDELGIPYAIVGGMALFAHGLRRFTEDVDILMTSDSLKSVHKNLIGLGYVRPFTRSKNLRDTELGVRIEFLVTGQFPGDGKPKPVAFPDPAKASQIINGRSYVTLTQLVELKLASGISNAERVKDFADVQELIKTLDLPISLSEKLNPYVRDKYIEIWNAAHGLSKRYIRIWRNKFLTVASTTIDEMIDNLQEATEILKAMRADGVTLDPEGGTGDDYAYLVTSNPVTAKKFDMHEESELFDADENEDEPR